MSAFVFRSGQAPGRAVSVVGALLLLRVGTIATAQGFNSDDLELTSKLHEQQAEHLDQAELTALITAGDKKAAFELAFEHGDELFETIFNALDGVGAYVGKGLRFTRMPRADLKGTGEWATHKPSRSTGPNAQSCNDCHRIPSDDGAGLISSNVVRDPFHGGAPGQTIQRNTPHLFGAGALQRLAEEMTEVLQAARLSAGAEACSSGQTVTRKLVVKGIGFGVIKATPKGAPCKPTFDVSGVVGVASDLVVRPYQWKGSVAFLRDFNRDASHNELGLQPIELVGENVDGDHDGIVDEMTVGDQTALAVYLASQPRPTTKTELASLGLVDPIPATEATAISTGRKLFESIKCSSCHSPSLLIDNPVFSEPSQNPNYCDKVFPSGQAPKPLGVDPAVPVTMDLTRDQPDNVIEDSSGRVVFRLGSFERDSRGRAIVRLYGDLRRHYMGRDLAESIDEVKTGASTFLTENLWGVGSTAPYLHDGRATTLTEAILAHGGEASNAKLAFVSLPVDSQKAIVSFLEDMILFRLPEE